MYHSQSLYPQHVRIFQVPPYSNNIICIMFCSRPSISRWICTHTTERSRSRIKTNVYLWKTTGLGFMSSLKTIHIVFLDHHGLWFDTQLLLQWLSFQSDSNHWRVQIVSCCYFLFVRLLDIKYSRKHSCPEL